MYKNPKISLEVRCILIKEKALAKYFKEAKAYFKKNGSYFNNTTKQELEKCTYGIIASSFSWPASIEGMNYWNNIDTIVRNDLGNE